MTSQMATCSAAIAASRVTPTAPSLAQPSVWISGWNVPTSQAARISASESSGRIVQSGLSPGSRLCATSTL